MSIQSSFKVLNLILFITVPLFINAQTNSSIKRNTIGLYYGFCSFPHLDDYLLDYEISQSTKTTIGVEFNKRFSSKPIVLKHSLTFFGVAYYLENRHINYFYGNYLLLNNSFATELIIKKKLIFQSGINIELKCGVEKGIFDDGKGMGTRIPFDTGIGPEISVIYLPIDRISIFTNYCMIRYLIPPNWHNNEGYSYLFHSILKIGMGYNF